LLAQEKVCIIVVGGKAMSMRPMKPGVVITEPVENPVHRFNPYAIDLTAEFFTCVNDIVNKYVGSPINTVTKNCIEQQLWLLASHLEMSGLMAPRMRVKTTYDGDHGAGRMTVELLDRDLLPIRKVEPGYVPQVV
jgi:hypothetical protein